MEVLVDDHPVALPGKRLRGFLAALLVRPRQVLTPDQLIEDVCVGGLRAHRTARASLHNLVSILRLVLGPDVLVTTSAGYALAIEGAETADGRFEALVAKAMMSTPRQQLQSLSDALALGGDRRTSTSATSRSRSTRSSASTRSCTSGRSRADRRAARAGRGSGGRPDGSRLAVPAPRATATHAHGRTPSQRTADRRRCGLRRLASSARCGGLRPGGRPVAASHRCQST